MSNFTELVGVIAIVAHMNFGAHTVLARNDHVSGTAKSPWILVGSYREANLNEAFDPGATRIVGDPSWSPSRCPYSYLSLEFRNALWINRKGLVTEYARPGHIWQVHNELKKFAKESHLNVQWAPVLRPGRVIFQI